jgi:hypothetical protein
MAKPPPPRTATDNRVRHGRRGNAADHGVATAGDCDLRRSHGHTRWVNHRIILLPRAPCRAAGLDFCSRDTQRDSPGRSSIRVSGLAVLTELGAVLTLELFKHLNKLTPGFGSPPLALTKIATFADHERGRENTAPSVRFQIVNHSNFFKKSEYQHLAPACITQENLKK